MLRGGLVLLGTAVVVAWQNSMRKVDAGAQYSSNVEPETASCRVQALLLCLMLLECACRIIPRESAKNSCNYNEAGDKKCADRKRAFIFYIERERDSIYIFDVKYINHKSAYLERLLGRLILSSAFTVFSKCYPLRKPRSELLAAMRAVMADPIRRHTERETKRKQYTNQPGKVEQH